MNFKDNILHLFKFYVRTSQNPLATDKEVAATKGLGLEMLCHAVDLLLYAAEIPKTEYASIELELDASGGECLDNDFSTEHSREYLEDYLLSKPYHDEFFEDTPIEQMTHDELAIVVCEHLSNQKLVGYYKTFGLVPYEEHSNYVSMRGKITTLVEKCLKYIE